MTDCHIKVKEPRLFYYLPIASGRIVGCIYFPRVLTLCEMQTDSSRVWTRIALLISDDDNKCTTSASFNYCTTTWYPRIVEYLLLPLTRQDSRIVDQRRLKTRKLFDYCEEQMHVNIICIRAIKQDLEISHWLPCSVRLAKSSCVSSSLVRCPIHSVLSHI